MASLPIGLPVRERIERIATLTTAPSWLRLVLETIAAEAASIEPVPDDDGDLPKFIYRH